MIKESKGRLNNWQTIFLDEHHLNLFLSGSITTTTFFKILKTDRGQPFLSRTNSIFFYFNFGLWNLFPQTLYDFFNTPKSFKHFLMMGATLFVAPITIDHLRHSFEKVHWSPWISRSKLFKVLLEKKCICHILFLSPFSKFFALGPWGRSFPDIEVRILFRFVFFGKR